MSSLLSSSTLALLAKFEEERLQKIDQKKQIEELERKTLSEERLCEIINAENHIIAQMNILKEQLKILNTEKEKYPVCYYCDEYCSFKNQNQLTKEEIELIDMSNEKDNLEKDEITEKDYLCNKCFDDFKNVTKLRYG
ncbi:MAG: hypothetical protein NTV32_09860 [Gammaproteobacteria bacterium]|nr:hypothetical protein [Gammaproteobacteria bacterium]